MNAIYQPNGNLIEQLERKGAFYNVELIDNYFMHDGAYKATGKRTVVNVDTGKAIGVVSKRYTPVLNKDIFRKFDKVLNNVEGVDLSGAYVDVQTNGDGARMMANYVLPAHTIALANGDEVALTITAINSFDGSTGFKVFCGGVRFKCMNGMVSGEKLAAYQKRHCAGLSIDAASMVIENGLNVYLKNIHSWNHQMNQRISEEMVWKCLAELANMGNGANVYANKADFDDKRNRSNADGSARKLVIDGYYEILGDYKRELGDNEWALNNTMTHISTHGLRKEKPSIVTQMNKAEQVSHIINKNFSKMAIAA